ncbi:MAG: Ig-like domain-containing protein [Salinivirgaceae bacterium]|nr:Ig-like domain-containing protein [Salinivirgaceae bacterium]
MNKLLFSLTITLFGFLSVMAQDPAQYGTPYTGVPNPMDANIYQLNLREYSASRDIEGARLKLQRIKDLGINVIYLMPIFPLGELNNPDGSPYSHKDLKSVASDLGDLNKLRQFVEDAHNKGMAVIIDWVANQTAWDHPWVTQHPDWYVQENGVIVPPCPAPDFCFTDVAHFDLNNSAAAAAMQDAMRYWVFAANIDGFRFDWADKAPPEYWTNTINDLRSISSHDLLLLAEGSNEGSTSGCTTCGENEPGYHWDQGFDYIFGTNFYWNVMKSVWNSGQPVTNLDGVTTGEYLGASLTQLVARYLSNHDDYNADGSPFAFMNGKSAVMSAFAVITYHRGVPFIYNGIEVGNTNPLPYPWNSGNINWSQDLSVYTEMQKILSVRNTSEALRRGQPTSYIDPANTNPDVIAFTKSSGTEKVAVMVNVRNSSRTFTIPSGMAGTYNDAFNPGTSKVLTAGASQSLAPYEYIVLTNANVPIVDVTGVSVSPTSISLNEGLTTSLSASVAPSNATNQTVSWSSSNAGIASVNANGLVTGVAPGVTAITVKTADGNKTALCTITVTPAPSFTVHFFKPSDWSAARIYWWSALPAGVLADGSWPGAAMTNEGDGWYSYKFTNLTSTNLIFNDGALIGNQSADLNRAGTDGWYQGTIWYDNKPGACTPTAIVPYTQINNDAWNQVATATLSAGESVSFGPQAADGGSWSWSGPNGYTASEREITLSNIQTNQSGNYLVIFTNTDGCTSNQTFNLTVNAIGQTPYNGVISLPGTVEVENFDNGDEGVAYHDADASNNGGLYRSTGVDIENCTQGGYNIGWTAAGEWMEYTVEVTNSGNYNLVFDVAGNGGSLNVTFNGNDKTGTVALPITNGWQTWQAASVNNVYLDAGVQIMRINILSSGFNINNVTISAISTIAVTGVTLNQSNITLDQENTQQLSETVLPTNASNKNVSWSSSNNTVASVSSNGLVTANIEGNAIITVTTEDGQKTAICNVQVNPIITGNYVRIKNRWQNTYLYQNNSQLSYGDIASSDARSHWIVEDYDGHKTIKNEQTNQLINIEGLQAYAECSSVESGYWSAQWAFENYDGYTRIRNRWQAGDYLHIENLLGYTQHSGADAGAWSGHWIIESSLKSGEIALSAIETESQFSVFPNPANTGMINIQSQTINGQVKIINLLGREVYTGILNESSSTIDVSTLQNGAYLIVINNGTKLFKSKILILN